jgi:hypothetical protein
MKVCTKCSDDIELLKQAVKYLTLTDDVIGNMRNFEFRYSGFESLSVN